MAFQSVPNAAEIVIQYLSNSVTAHNVLHATKVGGYNLTDLTALAVAVDASITADWLPLQTLDCSYESTTVRGLEFINDEEVSVVTGAAVGGDLSEALPGNVTFSVKKASGLTGRNARGRVYWIGLPSNQLKTNENQLGVTEAAAIVDAIDAMRVAISATDWTSAIVSRFLDGVKRPTGAVFAWTDSVAVDTDVDSMRNRLL